MPTVFERVPRAVDEDMLCGGVRCRVEAHGRAYVWRSSLDRALTQNNCMFLITSAPDIVSGEEKVIVICIDNSLLRFGVELLDQTGRYKHS